jgi:cAMP phosphodiesterase
MNIQILGAHSNESKKTKCISFLVDDTIAVDAGAISSTLTIRKQKKLNAILLTHSHFDHIKDVPLFALNCFRMNKRIHIYALPSVISTIKKHFLNGQVYPELFALPVEKPTVNFHRIFPSQVCRIEKYEITAITVKHHGKTVGYQIRDNDGKSFFYTSDTGPGLKNCWNKISCQLLFIETSFPNRYEEYARETGHLTPKLLLTELKALQKIRGELPQIVVVHNDPLMENQIKKELADVATALGISITVASEGMKLRI